MNLGQDKFTHFFGAYVVADTVFRFTRDHPMALLVGLAALVAKEWFDKARGGVFDLWDLLAGVVGLAYWLALHI